MRKYYFCKVCNLKIVSGDYCLDHEKNKKKFEKVKISLYQRKVSEGIATL